jgi:predicted enzyme related to lactoylglutathione lyase
MAEESVPKHRWNAAPYFLVDDVVATANFYRDQLGFCYTTFWGVPPQFTIVTRNGAAIMLKQVEGSAKMLPNNSPGSDNHFWDAYVWIDDADALYAGYTGKGVTILHPICDQDYGCREFTIRDCNGYTLGFGQDLNV